MQEISNKPILSVRSEVPVHDRDIQMSKTLLESASLTAEQAIEKLNSTPKGLTYTEANLR
jgi:hypothetical protein